MKRPSLLRTVHSPFADFTRPRLEIPDSVRKRLRGRLAFLYGDEIAAATLPELERIIQVYAAFKPPDLRERERDLNPEERFTERDIALITYGDLVRSRDRSPLATLTALLEATLQAINTLHILPFFPYSSDRGFAVLDFETVDPNLGTWADIEHLDGRFQMMFDGVVNHISSHSRWFQEFLGGSPTRRDYFIAYRSPDELTAEQRSLIRRPRTSDILTRFESIDGPRWVWTTFSPDQVDLNFGAPTVLLRVVEILLYYVRRGADIIRLDAVTYLWCEPGTSCASLAHTHEIVKLFRDIIDLAAPWVALITETNVPHAENVSYFGDGWDEAHLVYNFALPPLVLHTFYNEDATALSRWADALEKPSPTTHFFNFLDSHDGVGLLGARGILSDAEIDALVERARRHGALVSHRSGPQGEALPYELNVTWFSALNRDDDGETLDLQIRRVIASRSIQLVLRGVPAFYLLGLIGKRNDIAAVETSQSRRDINRTVLDYDRLMEEFNDPASKIGKIRPFARLNRVRASNRAFHPNGGQKVLHIAPEFFTVMRTSPEEDRRVLAITNVANRRCRAIIPLAPLDLEACVWVDLLSDRRVQVSDGALVVDCEPYDVVWLTPAS